MITILNTSVLTAFGCYAYESISTEAARRLVEPICAKCGMVPRNATFSAGCPRTRGVRSYGRYEPSSHSWDARFMSAIGHESTAQILTDLLGVTVLCNRIQYSQAIGARALIFKLQSRASEGKILTREEIDTIGYGFGLLTRTA